MWCSASRSAAAVAVLAALALIAGAAQAHPVARAHIAEYAPEVQSMVIGAGNGVISPDRWVPAGATSVQVGGRTCAVAAGTPLAVLIALRRAGGPGFALRDYGHCGSSPASSAELFVSSLGGEANHGQSGWEYKVEGVAGSTGAADPSGPRGDGRRLRAGARVLWFWCESSGGCERTLTVSPARATASRGGRLTVTVDGQDEEGRARAVAGATVALGGRVALTNSRGQVTLSLPARAGGYWLTASRRGMAPAFPGWIVLR